MATNSSGMHCYNPAFQWRVYQFFWHEPQWLSCLRLVAGSSSTPLVQSPCQPAQPVPPYVAYNDEQNGGQRTLQNQTSQSLWPQGHFRVLPAPPGLHARMNVSPYFCGVEGDAGVTRRHRVVLPRAAGGCGCRCHCRGCAHAGNARVSQGVVGPGPRTGGNGVGCACRFACVRHCVCVCVVVR